MSTLGEAVQSTVNEIEALRMERDALAADLATTKTRLARAMQGSGDVPRLLREIEAETRARVEAERLREEMVSVAGEAIVVAGELTKAAEARADSAEAELADVRATLADPHAVRVNLLRGQIANPPGLVFLTDTDGPIAKVREKLDLIASNWADDPRVTARDAIALLEVSQ